jgi:hypothetical protein
MRVTKQAFRASVAGWLKEERATKEQALQLLDAVYAGVIAGGIYAGSRGWTDDTAVPVDAVRIAGSRIPLEQREEDKSYESCGCLVDTLEQIRDARPSGFLEANSNTMTAFALAQRIAFGDTPSNSKWARAAAQGIEDYIAAKGW